MFIPAQAAFLLLVLFISSSRGQETGLKESLDFDDDEDFQDFLESYADENGGETPEGKMEKNFLDLADGLDVDAADSDAGQADSAEDDRSVGDSTAAIDGEFLPLSDWDCRFSWTKWRCVPTDYCAYTYKFLDATPTESCRLKIRPPERHGEIGGAQVHPMLAFAGATALFAGDLAAIAFTPALRKRPLETNVLQGFALFFSGDTYFQIFEQKWGDRIGYKASRSFKSGLIGALNNGFVHYSYYKWIDKNFPYHKFTEERWGPKDGARHKLIVAWTKYWIEFPTIGVYKIASSFVLTSALNNNVKSIGPKFKKRFMLTWLRSLQIWPLYDTIAYAYISTEKRPLYNAMLSIIWGGYLSHISQPEATAIPLEEETASTVDDSTPESDSDLDGEEL